MYIDPSDHHGCRCLQRRSVAGCAQSSRRLHEQSLHRELLRASHLESGLQSQWEDFEDRRDRLALALVADGVDAFVVEPGYTFKYYANISQPEWEVWEVCAMI